MFVDFPAYRTNPMAWKVDRCWNDALMMPEGRPVQSPSFSVLMTRDTH